MRAKTLGLFHLGQCMGGRGTSCHTCGKNKV